VRLKIVKEQRVALISKQSATQDRSSTSDLEYDKQINGRSLLSGSEAPVGASRELSAWC
jgi:hypothetical protein